MALKEVIELLFHDWRAPVLFAFVPWLVFWNQGALHLDDGSKLKVALGLKSGSCEKAGKTFEVEVARTPLSRARGLGGRPKPLGANEGMLFIFHPPEAVSFWMKETLIPLQLAFFDGRGRLSRMMEMAVEKDPNNPAKLYSSKAKIAAALELAPRALKAQRGHPVLCVMKD